MMMYHCMYRGIQRHISPTVRAHVSIDRYTYIEAIDRARSDPSVHGFDIVEE